MALDGLRWSRDSGSANCDMPRSAVFGRSGGGAMNLIKINMPEPLLLLWRLMTIKSFYKPTPQLDAANLVINFQ